MSFSLRELSTDSVELYQEEILGVGSYGKVCKAKYGQLPCAAKLLHDTLLQDNEVGTHDNILIGRFEQECQFLSTINHPNIVQYLGTTRDPHFGRSVLLMELMDGSLTKFLERSTGPLPYHVQLNICHDVALALSHLHSNAIIHRDLSSNNVLLISEASRAKVTDFGMSKLMDMSPRATPLTLCPGTSAYMPPEALATPPHYSSKLDCFSYGVLTIQIVTRKFPSPGDANRYVEDPNYPTGRVLVQFPERERRKKDIDSISPHHPLRSLFLHCLADREAERPSANELCERVAMMKREEKYSHSVELVTKGSSSSQQLIQEIEKGREALEREFAEKERLVGIIQKNEDELQRNRTELERQKKELARYKQEIEQVKKLESTEQNLQSNLQIRWSSHQELNQRAKMPMKWSSQEVLDGRARNGSAQSEGQGQQHPQVSSN